MAMSVDKVPGNVKAYVLTSIPYEFQIIGLHSGVLVRTQHSDPSLTGRLG